MVPGWQRLVVQLSLCSASAHAGGRSAFSKAVILPACGASRPSRLRQAKARLQGKHPHTDMRVLYQPCRLMIIEDALPAHGTRRSRKCDTDWPCRQVRKQENVFPLQGRLVHGHNSTWPPTPISWSRNSIDKAPFTTRTSPAGYSRINHAKHPR